jgi:hypothetical protein
LDRTNPSVTAHDRAERNTNQRADTVATDPPHTCQRTIAAAPRPADNVSSWTARQRVGNQIVEGVVGVVVGGALQRHGDTLAHPPAIISRVTIEHLGLAAVARPEDAGERNETAHSGELVASSDQPLGLGQVGLLSAGGDQLEVRSRPRQTAIGCKVRQPIDQPTERDTVIVDLAHWPKRCHTNPPTPTATDARFANARCC